jgi:hypothetical protein
MSELTQVEQRFYKYTSAIHRSLQNSMMHFRNFIACRNFLSNYCMHRNEEWMGKNINLYRVILIIFIVEYIITILGHS